MSSSEIRRSAAKEIFLEPIGTNYAAAFELSDLIQHQISAIKQAHGLSGGQNAEEILSAIDNQKSVVETAFTSYRRHATALLCDWSWIQRRVEEISLSEFGQTRREISADFVYPKYSAIPALGEDDSVEYAVPITMLRKGSLNSVTCRDQEGIAVPLLGRESNSALAVEAALGLIEGTEAEKALIRGIKDVVSDLHRVDDYTSEIAWKLINRAISDIVHSDGQDANFEQTIPSSRTQDVHRHNVFNNLALLSALARADIDSTATDDGHAVDENKPKNVSDGIAFSFWQLGWKREGLEDLEPSDGKNQRTHVSVLDSSLAVQLVMLGGLKVLASDQNERCLAQIETFFNFLSTVSISYPMFVAIGFEEGPDRRIINRRTIVKLSMDVQVADSDPEKRTSTLSRDKRLDLLDNPDLDWGAYKEKLRLLRQKDRWMNRLSALRSAAVVVSPDAIEELRRGIWIPFRFATLAAKSTHVEIVLPKGMQVGDVRVLHDKVLAELTGTDLTDSARGAIVRSRAFSGLYGRQSVGGKESKGGKVPVSPKNYHFQEEPRKDNHPRHGSFFQSQDHAHINSAITPPTPLETVQIQLQPLLSPQLLIAQVMTCVLALTGMLELWTRFTSGEKSETTIFNPDAGNEWPMTTLIVTVYLVLFVSDYFNRTVRLVLGHSNRQIVCYGFFCLAQVWIFSKIAHLKSEDVKLGAWEFVVIAIVLPLLVCISGSPRARQWVGYRLPRARQWVGSRIQRAGLAANGLSAIHRMRKKSVLIALSLVMLIVFIGALSSFLASFRDIHFLAIVEGLVVWVVAIHLKDTLTERRRVDKTWADLEAERYIKCRPSRPVERSFRKFNALTETGPWDSRYLSTEFADRVAGQETLTRYLIDRARLAGTPSIHDPQRRPNS